MHKVYDIYLTGHHLIMASIQAARCSIFMKDVLYFIFFPFVFFSKVLQHVMVKLTQMDQDICWET